MLAARNLGMSFGAGFRLVDVSLRVRPGERVAILGPNGSGKSTLLRLIAGLEAPQAGVISWDDTVLSRDGRILVPPERRGLSFLFQEGVLFPHLNVRANVALGLGPHATREQQRAEVPPVLASLGLAPLADRSIPELSGGEQQRVALARSLVGRPRLMLLDEPFQSLDRDTTRGLIAELRTVIAERRIAALLVTHEPDEAGAFADRVLLLRAGTVVQEGPLAELYRQPADAWAAGFLGPYGCIDTAQAHAGGIALPAGAAGPRLAFRPEDLILTVDAAGTLEVADVREYGMLEEVTLALPTGDRLVARRFAHPPLAPGQKVRAQLARALPPSVSGGPAA